jgi:hypothetical protein
VVGVLKLFGFLGVKLGEAAGGASVRRERREAEVEYFWAHRSQNNISVFVLHSGGNDTTGTLAAGFAGHTQW